MSSSSEEKKAKKEAEKAEKEAEKEAKAKVKELTEIQSNTGVFGSNFFADKVEYYDEEITMLADPLQNAATTIIGGGALGLIGYKVCSRFGTIGKLAGGIAGVWLGSKLGKKAVEDFRTAANYEKVMAMGEGRSVSGLNILKDTLGNMIVSGQSRNKKIAQNELTKRFMQDGEAWSQSDSGSSSNAENSSEPDPDPDI